MHEEFKEMLMAKGYSLPSSLRYFEGIT